MTANEISLQHGAFYSDQDSETYAEIHFTHGFSQGIRVITLVVDYIGPTSEKLATIAFRSMPKGVYPGENWKVHADNTKETSEPIHSGQSINLVGLAFTAVAVCPARARVSYVNLEFTDGSHFVRAAKDWTFPPTIRRAPYYASEPPPRDAIDSCARLNVRLDSSGKYESLRPLQDAPTSISSYAARQLAKWIFYPALKNGHPVRSEITVLFCLSRQEQFHFMRPEQAPVPTTMIQFFPSRTANGRWQAFWGSQPTPPRTHPEASP
jgi:hypothetical protein